LVLYIPLYLDLPKDGDLIAETCRRIQTFWRLGDRQRHPA